MAFGVKVMEQCRVSPPSGSVSKTSIPLTMYDLVYLTSSPVQHLFFYEFNCSTTLFVETILPGLKSSLSLTLQHFFPLAGNLAWPKGSIKPEIVYKDGDSVSFTVCESGDDFHHSSSNHGRDVEVLFSLVPQLIDNNTSKEYPVLALQVTLFPNNGICIGLTYHHAVGDGRSLIHFMKSWASVSCSQGDTSFISNSPPFYNRSMFNFIIDIETNYLDEFKKQNNTTMEDFILIFPENHHIQTDKVIATFVLSVSDIKKLEQWVLTGFSNKIENLSPPPRFSTFVITCAYVWICWIKARGNTMEDEDLVYLFFPIDVRGKVDPPLPQTYFGNCVRGGMAECKRSHLVGKDGMGIAVELIKEAIQNPGREPSVLSMLSDRRLGVNGSNKFGTYEIDFGWGKPKKAELASIAGAGAMSLDEGPGEAGSVEVGMVLNKKEMEAFASSFANTVEAIPPSQVAIP